MQKGTEVVVVGTPSMCCGVLMCGNKSKIKRIIRTISMDEDDEDTIVVLEDGSLHWSKNLVEV